MIGLSGIRKSFGDNVVLNGVNLDIPEAHVTALIGPSGSGKSTLLRTANLLEIPEEGKVEIGDASVAISPDRKPQQGEIRAVRLKTGMIFQNFQLFPHRSVVDNVIEGLVTVWKWPQAKAKQHAMGLLDKVGMANKAEAWPSTLSGGQQQRVAIARAIAASPKLLLCDEPTSALDPELAAEVVEVLRNLADEGMTMLMATHDLRLAEQIAHSVAFLEGGVIVEKGPPETIFRQPSDPRTARFVRTLMGAERPS